jgi:lambda family phage portal protein
MGLAERLMAKLGWQRTSVATANQQRATQYLGAAVGNLTRITGSNLSADRSLDANIRDLVKNSRDLARNNGYAKRFLRMARNNIAGPRGVAMRPVNTFANGKPFDRLNDQILEQWKRWGRREFCSANGRLSWLQIQRLAVSEWFTTGDGLVQIVYDNANPFGISLQPFDSDRLDRDFHRVGTATTNEVRGGVELDALGRAVAYYVLKMHPSEIGWARANPQFRDRIPADQILHLWTQDERVDLTRGAPHLAVAMRDLMHIGDAQDASLIALKMNALNPAFIETAAGPDSDVEDPPEGETLIWEGEGGQYPYLGKGQKISTLDPNVPQDNYPDFTRAVLRSAAVGLGTSYAMLAGDWSDANFASMRVGRMDEVDEWIALQEHFIANFCIPVFERWLMSAMLKGQITVPEYDIQKANRVEWQGRRWISPKPLEDVEVAEREIALGINSRSAIKAARGESLWDTWEELAEENQYAREKQLNVEPPRSGAAPAEPEKPNGDDGESAKKPDAEAGRQLRLARSVGNG